MPPSEPVRPPCRKPRCGFQPPAAHHSKIRRTSPPNGGWIAARSNAIRRAISQAPMPPSEPVRPPCRKPRSGFQPPKKPAFENRRKTQSYGGWIAARSNAIRRAISQAPMPSSDPVRPPCRKPQCGFQPPKKPSFENWRKTQTCGGWIAARSNAIRRAISQAQIPPCESVRPPCPMPPSEPIRPPDRLSNPHPILSNKAAPTWYSTL